jgi:hypothetical protein
MKKILLLFTAILISVQSLAQDPDLFQTWYLYTIEFENGDTVIVDNFDPPIAPDLTIYNDFSYFGNGACNTIEGNFTFVPSSGLEIASKSQTLAICGFDLDMFEGDYFGFFEEGTYMIFTIITQTNGDQTLVLHGGPFTTLTFGNVQLLNSDFKTEKIKIHPNPVKNWLFIASENTQIESIKIYSLSGKRVYEVSKIDNSIDVTGLSEGVYFVEILSEAGKSIQKFIKE